MEQHQSHLTCFSDQESTELLKRYLHTKFYGAASQSSDLLVRLGTHCIVEIVHSSQQDHVHGPVICKGITTQ